MKKFQLVTLGLLASYSLVLTQDKKDFCPFSTFPMFSQAGTPWTRAVVRDVTRDSSSWSDCPTELERLPGRPWALARHGMNVDDLSALVGRTSFPLSKHQARTYSRYFGSVGDKTLVLYEVRGSFASGRTQTRILLRAKVDRAGIVSMSCSTGARH